LTITGRKPANLLSLDIIALAAASDDLGAR